MKTQFKPSCVIMYNILTKHPHFGKSLPRTDLNLQTIRKLLNMWRIPGYLWNDIVLVSVSWYVQDISYMQWENQLYFAFIVTIEKRLVNTYVVREWVEKQNATLSGHPVFWKRIHSCWWYLHRGLCDEYEYCAWSEDHLRLYAPLFM